MKYIVIEVVKYSKNYGDEIQTETRPENHRDVTGNIFGNHFCTNSYYMGPSTCLLCFRINNHIICPLSILCLLQNKTSVNINFNNLYVSLRFSAYISSATRY